MALQQRPPTRPPQRGPARGPQRPAFVYKPRSVESVKKRAERTGGSFDMPYKSGFDLYKAKAGDNMVRILPPTWDDADHFGLTIFVHRYVGADGGTYLCLRKMKGEPCAVCDAHKEAHEDGDAEAAKQLQVTERVLYWLLDRDSDPIPMLYDVSWTMDRDITKLTRSAKTGQTIYVDSDTEGFDLSFTRLGQGLKTRYSSFAFDRDPSALSEDPREHNNIMARVLDNPLPSVLLYQSNDYLAKVMQGTNKAADALDETVDQDDELEQPTPRTPQRAAARSQPRVEREVRRAPPVEEVYEDQYTDEPEQYAGDEGDAPFDDSLPETYVEEVEEPPRRAAAPRSVPRAGNGGRPGVAPRPAARAPAPAPRTQPRPTR